MILTAFGELTFKVGFKKQIEITLFGKTVPAVLKAKAYYERDGLTVEQLTSLCDLHEHLTERMKTAETLLEHEAKQNAASRFTARTLLVQRDGEYALLLDDAGDEEEGVAVVLSPITQVLPQSEYL